jgi:hypothetical protein
MSAALLCIFRRANRTGMALHLTSTDNLNIVVIEFGGDVWRFRPPQVATKEWNYKVAGKLGTGTTQSIYVRNER